MDDADDLLPWPTSTRAATTTALQQRADAFNAIRGATRRHDPTEPTRRCGPQVDRRTADYYCSRPYGAFTGFARATSVRSGWCRRWTPASGGAPRRPGNASWCPQRTTWRPVRAGRGPARQLHGAPLITYDGNAHRGRSTGTRVDDAPWCAYRRPHRAGQPAPAERCRNARHPPSACGTTCCRVHGPPEIICAAHRRRDVHIRSSSGCGSPTFLNSRSRWRSPRRTRGAFEEGIGFDGSRSRASPGSSSPDTVARPTRRRSRSPVDDQRRPASLARMFCDITMPDGSPSWADRHAAPPLAKASDLGFSCPCIPRSSSSCSNPAV